MPSETVPSAELSARLSRALEISHRMLSAARSGDWPRLAALEAERAPLLEASALLLPALLPQVARARLVGLLADCQRVNEQLAELVGDHVCRLREILGVPPQADADAGAAVMIPIRSVDRGAGRP